MDGGAVIHAASSPRTLGVVRFFVFGLWLCMIAVDPFQELAQLPAEIFEPLGPLRLVPDAAWAYLLTTPYLIGFKVVLLVLLALCAAGARPYRTLAIAAAILLTAHQGLVRGFGFIQHRELALLMATYVLAIFPAADGFTLRPKEGERAPNPIASAALVLMTLAILIAYFVVGSYRLTHAAPEIFTSNSMRYYLAYTSFRQNYYPFELGQWVLASPLASALVNAGFLLVTVLELLSPLCLINRRFRYLWIAVMFPFHVASLLLMKIFFWQNLLLLSLLLVDLERVVARFGARRPKWTA